QQRRRVAGTEALALRPPERLARPAVEREQRGRAVLVVVHVDPAVVLHRRGPDPVLRLERPEVLLPLQVALEVEGGQSRGGAVPEQGVDALAVGGRGGGGERVVLVQGLGGR